MRRRTIGAREAAPRFRPRRIEDVFAVYLSRELADTKRIRFYARLTERYSLCLLLNALRRARAEAGANQVEPERFVAEMVALLDEKEGELV